MEPAVIAAIVAASAATFTAIVAAATSIVATIINIRQSKTVEFNKHKQAILEYRCEKLFIVLNTIMNSDIFLLPTIDGVTRVIMDGAEDEGKDCDYVLIERIGVDVNRWRFAEPLIEDKFRKNVLEVLAIRATGTDELIEHCAKLETAIVEAIQAQLAALLVEQNKA